jgi:lysophospholipase L1-like esterase
VTSGIDASSNTAGNLATWFSWDRSMRVRQTGQLISIQVYSDIESTSANIDSMWYNLWRKTPEGVYNLIYELDVSSYLIDAGGAIVEVPIPDVVNAVEGDFHAFVARSTPGGINRDLFQLSSSGALFNSTKWVWHTEKITSGYEWESSPTNAAFKFQVKSTMANPFIAGIGNSLMQGIPANYSFLYPLATDVTDIESQILFQLKQLDSRFTYQNLGAGGNRTDEMLSRISQLIEIKPKLALIGGGVNDISQGVTNSVIKGNIAEIVDSCVANDIYPIVMNVFPWTNGTNAQMQQRDSLKTLITDTLNSRGFDFTQVDLDEAIGIFRAGGDPGNLWNISFDYWVDGVHLDIPGYTKVAESIYEQIKNRFEILKYCLN